MNQTRWVSAIVGSAATIATILVLQDGAQAQGRGRGGNQPPPTAKAGAPFDLTGYWVAEVTEDWRWRMVTPTRGDWESVPMTPEAQAVADKWDPKTEPASEQCKSYGAPALMRTPTRLNVTWQDENTLSVQADNGTQTRLLHFGGWKSPGGEPTWQGDSVAQWEAPAGGTNNVRPGFGTLKVVTNHLRPGYLRKNGVPYSANAVLTEYWDLVKEDNGDERILLLLEVEDPLYLTRPLDCSGALQEGSEWSEMGSHTVLRYLVKILRGVES